SARNNDEVNYILNIKKLIMLNIPLQSYLEQASQKSTINNYPEFVCPQNFRNIADWVYGWPKSIFNEKTYSTSLNKINKVLQNGSIIYVRAGSLDEFFNEVYPHLRVHFVLITGEGDLSVPKSEHLKFITEPSKILHWYGQNGQILSDDQIRFTHTPIGLNCYEMAAAIRTLYTKVTNQQRFVLHNYYRRNDPTGTRNRLWHLACFTPHIKKLSKQNSSLTKSEWFNFSSCIYKQPGVEKNVNKLVEIYLRNRQYPMWISPRGIGIDCHRTWEALYLNVIPIVENSTLNSLYQELPMIIVNNWTTVNEKFLREQLTAIIEKKQRHYPYKWEKLQMSYWRRLISNYSAPISNRTICWHSERI
ncbi:unnamed protein product, partial [Didymodactylos carnosus]